MWKHFVFWNDFVAASWYTVEDVIAQFKLLTFFLILSQIKMHYYLFTISDFVLFLNKESVLFQPDLPLFILLSIHYQV